MKPRRYEIADMNLNFQYFIFIRENRILGQVDYGMVKNLLIVLVNSYRNSRKIAYRRAKIPYIFRVHKYLQNKTQYNYMRKRTIMQAKGQTMCYNFFAR